MSENDRMERAKRIRRMREGQRDEESEDTESEPSDRPGESTPDSPSPETTTSTAPEATASPTGDNETTETGAASTDGGAATASAESDIDESDETASDETTTAETEPVETESGQDIDDATEDAGGTTASLPSTEEMEAAMEDTMAEAEKVDETDETDEETPASPAGIAAESDGESRQKSKTRILEFTLDDEQYCLDIEYIEEIVKHTNITRVPNTPDFVEGVVDLRGQITTILNPKVTIGKDDQSPGDLIVVFDAEAFEDQGHIGWVVDDVRQVSPVHDDEVNDPPMADDHVNGVIDREDDDQFVIWTSPDLVFEESD